MNSPDMADVVRSLVGGAVPLGLRPLLAIDQTIDPKLPPLTHQDTETRTVTIHPEHYLQLLQATDTSGGYLVQDVVRPFGCEVVRR